ncbi:MAG TPA: glycosyltransferase family 2 protein [Phycisphaerae bacterium]|nr:glycosyltransferase family 2 protein [Phycisphaerae bacterium]
MRTLIAVPVFNEERHLEKVLAEIRQATTADLLVVDDGSTDATSSILTSISDINIIRHRGNIGYGRSLIDAFRFAARREYDWIITMDCDEQHEPAAIPEFEAAMELDNADIISGSRYQLALESTDAAPRDRRTINRTITQVINENLGLNLTDSFCGFKAHRVSAVRDLPLTEAGYAFPMQFWVLAACTGLRIVELPVRLIYNDPTRHFGGQLDDPIHRLRHYLEVFYEQLQMAEALKPGSLVTEASSVLCSQTDECSKSI